jgi:hypothetical protein
MALPSPLPLPVTTAVFPSSLNIERSNGIGETPSLRFTACSIHCRFNLRFDPAGTPLLAHLIWQILTKALTSRSPSGASVFASGCTPHGWGGRTVAISLSSCSGVLAWGAARTVPVVLGAAPRMLAREATVSSNFLKTGDP